MGYYSMLEKCDAVKTFLSFKEFSSKWEDAIKATAGTDLEGYLDSYSWALDKDDGDHRHFYLDMDDWYGKHYANYELAEFIAGVIAPEASCILEFSGEDGCQWGYYIQAGSVKEIEYIRMVDGKPI